jgi:hypothetical protein
MGRLMCTVRCSYVSFYNISNIEPYFNCSGWLTKCVIMRLMLRGSKIVGRSLSSDPKYYVFDLLVY